MDAPCVLLVEDDRPLGSLIAGFLRDRGHHLEWARTLTEAAAILARGPCLAAITDLHLGPRTNLDGLEVIDLVKRAQPQAPVVLLTSLLTRDDEAKALARGASLVLEKPMSLKLLARTLEELLSP